MKPSKIFLPMSLSFFVSACAVPGPLDAGNLLTIDGVKECITVEDDRTSKLAIFLLGACFDSRGERFYDRYSRGEGVSELYIRAVKYKNSNSVQYYGYVVIVSSDWGYPYSVRYLKPTVKGDREPIQVVGNRLSDGVGMLRVESDVSCNELGCKQLEHFVFSLKRDYLKALSDNYESLASLNNREEFRILRKVEDDIDFVMDLSELVGVYRKVESY